MRKPFYYISVIVVALMLALTSCSVKKNTAATRGYHHTKARYNILFNGREAYKKGQTAVHAAVLQTDDYNEVLPVFEESAGDATKAASADMDRVIEKCDKAIQLHSIVKKPKKNPKKSRDPKYKAFMAKEEYNSEVQAAWLLKGKALAFKEDYAASAATLAYASKHFQDNPDVATESKLWEAKVYAQQGWYYEAEDILNRLSEKAFSARTTKLYVLVKADLLLRQKQYEAALPYLQNAIEITKKDQRKRVMFIYAQVLEKLKRYGEAYNAYEAVKKKRPDYVMEFNSVLGMAKCYQGSSMDDIKKEVDRLVKRASNADYLDRIYFTMGTLYQRKGDKAKAMEYYQLAIEKSTRNGIDKAHALLALGSIYYDEEDYLKAQPLYAEAVNILSIDHPGYKELQTRSQNLDYVAQYSGVVTLQDSLLFLASLPQDKMIEKVKAEVERIHKEQEEAQKRLEEEARQQAERDKSAAMAAAANLSLGESLDQSWYFYNNTLISKGKLDFQKQWGGRSLEDDWRRSNKVSTGFELEEDNEDMEEVVAEEAASEEIAQSSTGDAEIDSYLRQIPVTEVMKQSSNAAIEEALYNLYKVYDERILNKRLATETYNELLRRYPNTEFGQSKESVDENNEKEAEALYTEAYAALKSGNRYIIQTNLEKMEKCCADSKLMPKIYMIEALSGGRASGREVFKNKLQTIIEKYPESEVTPIARDMLALVGQGKEIVSTSTPVSTIAENRQAVIVSQNEYAEAIQKAGFIYNPDDQHSFIIVIMGNERQKNDILFALAQYNFTRFMIKDFDFNVKKLDEAIYAVGVTPLSSLNEAVWYQNSVLGDASVHEALTGVNYKAFVISDENFVKVFDKESLIKYIEFYQNNNLEVRESDVIEKLEQESGFVK